MGINEIYGRYLFFSYSYYKMNISCVSDEIFDDMCKTLLEKWDEVTHKYKNLISKEDLEAGTGYAIQYPSQLENYFKRELDRIRLNPTKEMVKWTKNTN